MTTRERLENALIEFVERASKRKRLPQRCKLYRKSPPF